MGTTDYASYELAQKLKACGFDEPCIAQWACEPDDKPMLLGSTAFVFSNAELKGRDVTAPLLFHAQKWLREKKGIYAYCEPNCLKKWSARAVDLAKNEDLLFDGEMFDSFEKATEYAISSALELIKKGE